MLRRPAEGSDVRMLLPHVARRPSAAPGAVAARCAMARCLARQWFGVLLRAATPLDEWLVEGKPQALLLTTTAAGCSCLLQASGMQCPALAAAWLLAAASCTSLASTSMEALQLFIYRPVRCSNCLFAGLSGWLEEQFVRHYLGRNELAYK